MTYFIFDRLYIFQLHHITNENNTKLPEKHWVSFSALPISITAKFSNVHYESLFILSIIYYFTDYSKRN